MIFLEHNSKFVKRMMFHNPPRKRQRQLLSYGHYKNKKTDELISPVSDSREEKEQKSISSNLPFNIKFFEIEDVYIIKNYHYRQLDAIKDYSKG